MTVEPLGRLIDECSLPGERRADDVFPAHPNGLQASRRTWLLLYATRGWRAVDDDRSIVYQLRRGAPDGELVTEGVLAASADDWDATGDGTPCVRQHGHPVLFGMPRGARLAGQEPAHAGLFVAKWRIKAMGRLDPATGTVSRDHDLWERTQGVQCVQFRLNAREDGIEIVQPAAELRQEGWEQGARFCAADVRWMNQTFTQAVPYAEDGAADGSQWVDGTQWVDVNHFDGGRVAALRYRFDAAAGVYRWTDTGPLVAGPGPWRHSEASIARSDDGWLIASTADRDGDHATGWVRTADPFGDVSDLTLAADPPTSSPRTLYRCPDGVLRLLSGDPHASPYGLGRNPLYLWDVDPRTLRTSRRREIFDCVASGTLPRETDPVADMGKLLPHAGGRAQWVVWRVRTRNVHHTYADPTEGARVASAYGFPPLRDEWKEPQGIYYGRIMYDGDLPGLWRL